MYMKRRGLKPWGAGLPDRNGPTAKDVKLCYVLDQTSSKKGHVGLFVPAITPWLDLLHCRSRGRLSAPLERG